MKEDLPEGNEMARYTFYRHYSIFFDVCKKCMEGIDGNSSLLDNYDAQQIVDYVRDFAAAFEGSMKELLSIFLRMLMEFRTITVSCRMLPKRLWICMEGRNECPVQR